MTQHSKRMAWFTLTILCSLYVIAYVDRGIAAVVATSLSTALDLSDTELALIISSSFAFAFVLAAVPAAQWMDNRDRRYGLAAGVALWGGATIACGFANSFEILLILRAGVAVGEAALGPAAVSLIADMFPGERRAIPTTIYALIGTLVGAGGLALGATALDIGHVLAPIVDMDAWRLTFVIAGVPAVTIALLIVLAISEPPRSQASDGEKISLMQFARYMRRRWNFYLPFYLGSGLGSMFPLALTSWAPTLLLRAFGFREADAAYVIGISGMIAAVTGTLVFSMLARRSERLAPGQGLLLVMAGAALFIAAMAWAPAAQSRDLFVLGAACAIGGWTAWILLPLFIVQRFAPNRVRARVYAIHPLCTSVIGFGLGPMTAAGFSTSWSGDHALGYGLAALGLVASPIAALCYFFCYRAAPSLLGEDDVAAAGDGSTLPAAVAPS